MILGVSNLSYSYNNSELFSDLNFSVEAGEKIGIKGASGKGKSTLLGIIMGFSTKYNGKIAFKDFLLNEQNIKIIRRQIGWVPQEPIFIGNVLEHLKSPYAFSSNKNLEFSISNLEQYLNKFQLKPEILSQDMSSLSGGEKQRISLIQILMLGKKILLLDEPVSALDESTKNIVIDEILDNNELTVISTSHDEKWLKKCSRIIEL